MILTRLNEIYHSFLFTTGLLQPSNSNFCSTNRNSIFYIEQDEIDQERDFLKSHSSHFNGTRWVKNQISLMPAALCKDPLLKQSDYQAAVINDFLSDLQRIDDESKSSWNRTSDLGLKKAGLDLPWLLVSSGLRQSPHCSSPRCPPKVSWTVYTTLHFLCNLQKGKIS